MAFAISILKKLVIYDKIHYTKLVQKCEGSTMKATMKDVAKLAGVGVGTCFSGIE